MQKAAFNILWSMVLVLVHTSAWGQDTAIIKAVGNGTISPITKNTKARFGTSTSLKPPVAAL